MAANMSVSMLFRGKMLEDVGREDIEILEGCFGDLGIVDGHVVILLYDDHQLDGIQRVETEAVLIEEQGVRLDMDTMIALLIVWFLLMDDDGAVDWEQFLLTAALLLFGL